MLQCVPTLLLTQAAPAPAGVAPPAPAPWAGPLPRLTAGLSHQPLPAGGVAILAVWCGKDASGPFTMQHGQDAEPQGKLPQYLVGDLSA